jgi:hypothetical protein
MPKREDGLSPADLANIARLSVKPVYRIYFNLETGELLAASNEVRPEYDYSLTVQYEQYEAFVSGREEFKNWSAVKTKTFDNEYGVELVQKEFQGHTFRNNMFEWIIDPPTTSTELIVHWDEFNNQWIFMMSNGARQKVYDKKIITKIIKFFITLENDFDFLIKTIDIELHNLLSDKVVVPFTTTLETQIDKISISSKTVFDSYGLKVWKVKTK